MKRNNQNPIFEIGEVVLFQGSAPPFEPPGPIIPLERHQFTIFGCQKQFLLLSRHCFSDRYWLGMEVSSGHRKFWLSAEKMLPLTDS